MSQPAVAALTPLPFELVMDDGEPLESAWHAIQFPYLRDLIRQAMAEQGRTDFFTGGDNFVYYSVEQARRVFDEETKGLQKRAFRGPDVFWVGGVDPGPYRPCWISWEEGGKLPDVVFELLSPSTAKKDRTEKRDLYSRVWHTAEYFLHDPDTCTLEGLRLTGGSSYRPIQPDAQGRFWSEQLGVLVGLWHGVVSGVEADWVRLFHEDGTLVPTEAEAERQKAEAERQRADAMEAEVRRLRALLEGRE
jgi:Uma2 family endonuclease